MSNNICNSEWINHLAGVTYGDPRRIARFVFVQDQGIQAFKPSNPCKVKLS